MTNIPLVGTWIRRFLLEHLVAERNLARNTQISYRDTLALLLPFVSKSIKRPIDRLSIENLSPTVIRRFLDHLERERRCSVATRNQRLAAIHALARFVGLRSPEHLAWCGEVRSIPWKKAASPAVGYLEKPEMDALLESPDRLTAQGRRDYTLLLFLYNSGARATEAAQLLVSDLELRSSPAVRIVGKGSKIRHCPLWNATAHALSVLVSGRAPNESVFLNRRHEPLTRFGIYAMIKRSATKAACQTPSLQTKRVSTHMVRHTAAVHLLRAGVDINTIRAWLGHVSLDTTHVYAEIDLETKAEALAHCEISTQTIRRSWRADPNVMEFLKNL